MHVKFSHQDIALIFLLISVILPRFSSMLASKLASFIAKWLLRLSTCTFLTFATSVLTNHSRPLLVLFISFFLGYGLVESMYVWFVICRYAKFDFPLFAKYSSEGSELIWPAGKIFEKIRQTLAKNEFKFAATLVVKVEATPVMSAPIFYSDDGCIRLQMTFSHFDGGRTFVNCVLVSHLRNGAIFVTHNLQSPIAAFYVPPFEAHQKQFSMVKNLISSHKKRIKKSHWETMCLCGENCLQAINDEQLRLEEANIAQGYCEQVDGRTNAAISFLGRYRLWTKGLLATYLGL
ncbi:MAG: hypothetical protein LBF42_02755 [Puniceicoccales bacterium]|jgi:hypothetical protein|nr:hypothetical protein [Puniceicoccales bacterium]